MAQPADPVNRRLRFDDQSITRQRIRPGTVRRILPYALRYRWRLVVLLLTTVTDAVITATGPVMLKLVIDSGIVHRDKALVVGLALAIAAMGALDAAAVYTQSRFSARIGEGLVYDLRVQVFDHVQRQPIAFFTRAQTGSLVSRLNTDVVGAQQAVTTLLSQSVSTLLTLVLILATMFFLSWQITVLSLLLIPIFLIPARLIGRRTQRLAREGMQLTAELGTLMNERFNVSGAMLAKLYGRPAEETGQFAHRAGRVRDIAVGSAVYGRMFFVLAGLLSSVTTALVYGVGGTLVVDRSLEIGILVAMVALLLRLYGPINQLSTMQNNVLSALVSFDRVFEILDLEPLVAERRDAVRLPAAASAPRVEFDSVSFRYPRAGEVALASLETLSRAGAENAEQPWALQDLSFTVPAGGLTALVGPSGAGKSTIISLVSRLYDVGSGAVLIDGHDVRSLTLDSLRETVGVVTQDAHLFHDTIRANLRFARPEAEEADLVEACRAARIWDAVAALPDGLDTVVGDRGYRLSGGEKQRIALARLLLKAPRIVVLDEATAHLDSESEAAVQRALKTALAGRTSLVVAHRLSTIREADQILVVAEGRIAERGTHEELLASGGLYAELYHAQFAHRTDAHEEVSAP